MELAPIPPGGLGDGKAQRSTWQPHPLRMDFAVPDEVSGAGVLEKANGLDAYPPRKRLLPMKSTSFELSPFPHDHKRLVANRARRAFGPDNHMKYDMARLCAYLVIAKHATHHYLPTALGKRRRRPYRYRAQLLIEYMQRLYDRACNDFLSEYCYNACQLDVVPVRPDEIALWNEWNKYHDVERPDWGSMNLNDPIKPIQQELLTQWCHKIPDVADKFSAFRVLSGFRNNSPQLTLWCSVCEHWNPKASNRKTSENEMLLHVCRMGKVENHHQLELLKLTAKFCQKQVEPQYLWPKL